MATVEVSIPVNEQTVDDLRRPALRAFAGQVVCHIMERRRREVARLFDVMDRFAAEAWANGLTDEIVAEELASYDAERRGPGIPGP